MGPLPETLGRYNTRCGVKGITGARWLFGGMLTLGNTTSCIVGFFDSMLAPGRHLKVREPWLSMKATTFTDGEEFNGVYDDR